MLTLRELIVERDRCWLTLQALDAYARPNEHECIAARLTWQAAEMAVCAHPIMLAVETLHRSDDSIEALDALLAAIVPEAMSQCTQMLDEIRRLRAALAVYAEEQNWATCGHRIRDLWMGETDNGWGIAQAALTDDRQQTNYTMEE